MQIEGEWRVAMGHIVERLATDIRYSFRSLVRCKGFATTVILTLSGCIAVNLVVFVIIDKVLLRPLPFPNANSIILMANRYPRAGAGDLITSSSGDYFDRLKYITALQDQAMAKVVSQTITMDKIPEQITAMAVTPSLFRVLQVFPRLGRPFKEEEAENGRDRQLIMSDGLCRQLFGARDPCLGRTVELSTGPFEVIGVMPPSFEFINPDVRLWIPLVFTAEQRNLHHSNNWYNIGRLRRGESIKAVQAQLDSLNAANLQSAPNRQMLLDAGFHSIVERLQDALVKDIKQPLLLLWVGAVLILMIGALNVANLVYARLHLRQKEMVMRLALGARRSALSRQLFIEDLLLSLSGAVGGVTLGIVMLHFLIAERIGLLAEVQGLGMTGRSVVLAIILAFSIAALLACFSSGFLINSGPGMFVGENDRTKTGGRSTRVLRRVLVVAQVGFAFSLMVSAGLLLTSLRTLLHLNPGFRAEGVVTATANVPESRYMDSVQLQRIVGRMLASIRQIPGVTSAGVTTNIPFGTNYDDTPILPAGYAVKPGETLVSSLSLQVTPGYFETMGISLRTGRYFYDKDDGTAPRVVIVDERVAQRFWPGKNPIGERIYEPDLKNPARVDSNTILYKVVGVVSSVRLEDLSGKGDSGGAFYLPFAQNPSSKFTLAVRLVGDDLSIMQSIRKQVAVIDPQLPLFDLCTMSQRIELSLASRRLLTATSMGFGVLALLLASVGIYGVLAYLVSERQREIAIRMALGSTHWNIIALVLKEVSVLILVGLSLGVAGIVSARGLLANQLFGIGPLNPFVIGATAVLFGIIALIGCILPARRAAKVDPAIVLSEQ